MNYRKTGRIFNLALRVADAKEVTESLGVVSLRWDIHWQDVLPTDIHPNSTFICTHSFKEEGVFTWPMDYCLSNRRNHDLTCNLASFSYMSDQVNTYQGGAAGRYPATGAAFTRQNGTALKQGFINTMDNEIFSLQAGGGDTVEDIGYLWGTCKYSCEPRSFECLGPEARSSVTISYWDQSPPPTLAQLNADTPKMYAFGTPQRIANLGGYVPMFYRVNNKVPDITVYSTGPPLGTHVFSFELVDRIPFREDQF